MLIALFIIMIMLVCKSANTTFFKRIQEYTRKYKIRKELYWWFFWFIVVYYYLFIIIFIQPFDEEKNKKQEIYILYIINTLGKSIGASYKYLYNDILFIHF